MFENIAVGPVSNAVSNKELLVGRDRVGSLFGSV